MITSLSLAGIAPSCPALYPGQSNFLIALNFRLYLGLGGVP